MDLVSAIVTTCNRKPDKVLRAIKSIKDQTYSPIEIIVVDDSPSSFEFRKEVKKAVEELDSNIIYIQNEEQRGACYSRNVGLENANGEYVAFLDDDDEWIDTKIEKQISKMTPSVDLVYCGYLCHHEDTNITDTVEQKYIEGFVFDELIKDNFVGSTSFPLIRKQALIDIGGFDVDMPASQDYDVWLRLSKEHYIAYVNEPLVIYNTHTEDRVSKSYSRKIDGIERIIQKNDEYLSNHRTVKANKYLRLLDFYARDKQIKKAFELLVKAIALNPFNAVQILKHTKVIFKEI